MASSDDIVEIDGRRYRHARTVQHRLVCRLDPYLPPNLDQPLSEQELADGGSRSWQAVPDACDIAIVDGGMLHVRVGDARYRGTIRDPSDSVLSFVTANESDSIFSNAKPQLQYDGLVALEASPVPVFHLPESSLRPPAAKKTDAAEAAEEIKATDADQTQSESVGEP